MLERELEVLRLLAATQGEWKKDSELTINGNHVNHTLEKLYKKHYVDRRPLTPGSYRYHITGRGLKLLQVKHVEPV